MRCRHVIRCTLVPTPSAPPSTRCTPSHSRGTEVGNDREGAGLGDALEERKREDRVARAFAEGGGGATTRNTVMKGRGGVARGSAADTDDVGEERTPRVIGADKELLVRHLGTARG